MRFVIQRVSEASVKIDGAIYSEIQKGFLVLVGVEEADTKEDADWLCQKLIGMRIFADDDDKMNLSLQDINGDVLLVSQFTLFASTKKVTDLPLSNQLSLILLFRFTNIAFNNYLNCLINQLKQGNLEQI